MSSFEAALRDVCTGWAALRPTERLTVAEAAARHFVIKRPGGGSGLYDPSETPAMVEPGACLTDRRYKGVCFIGSSQSGKTILLGEAWLLHSVLFDPGDFLMVQMTQDKARDYSKQRIDRMIRASDDLREMLGSQSRDDNLHDKFFKNGMFAKIAWPTASNLASSSFKSVYGTDYDRWPDDIDGEGDGWTQMLARITTFMSRGRACVETSPGRNVKEPGWTAATPHEAPPVGGGLGIYNTSDRRRWYWKCPHCGDRFEAAPGLSLFRLPSDTELLEDIRALDLNKYARQMAHVICPQGCVITAAHKRAMNRGGVWLRDGLTIDDLDRISGTPRESNIAGFWLGGVAATYRPWHDLLETHLQALLEYELTGGEEKLKTCANTVLSIPYTPRFLVESERKDSTAKPTNDLPRFAVPEWTRFVVTSVDVQAGLNARFVVQTVAVGADRRKALVNRYAITESEREGADGAKAPLDPGQYPEDWNTLTKQVIGATYKLPDGEREIRTRLTLVDSGGEDGVTLNAYAWFRRLRQAGLHDRVRVTKGTDTKTDWSFKQSYVGGKQGSGDIPLWLFDANKFKDLVDAGLKRPTPGPGFYYWPTPRGPKNPEGWMPQAVLDELAAEVRLANGKWSQVKKRNETFDLCVLAELGTALLGCDRRGWWDNPPTWALPLDQNSDVLASETRRLEKADTEAAVASAARRSYRRANASPYLR